MLIIGEIYGVYISLKDYGRFCSFRYQEVEKIVKDPLRIPRPLIQDPDGSLAILTMFRQCD